ncbi:MAG: asparagine synthase (glutamine-hydrolyzing) [Clostridia bacterium]|nr:asparagine synthase (glutamine-hydrolyzing) [Clostridia bacterium]
MCGFAGIFKDTPIIQQDISDLRKMSDAISHRGPDDSKEIIDTCCAMAFRRLSIIDLEKGVQPFTDKENRFTGIFNGEIYNYLDLRSELVNKGITFDTRSEIETILALYKLDGAGFITRLRGMFAIVIYDRQENTLFFGRDPFGIKPFYYRESGDRIVFSSEFKTFVHDSSMSDGYKVDKTALQHYLTFQYVPEPNTITPDIKVLPAGHYALLSKGEKLKPVRYADYRLKPNSAMSFDEKEKNLRRALENSVRAHMLSDVPVGSFLSSGIDSAVITSIASKLCPGIKAFTISFGVKDYSEMEDACEIADHLDIEHIKRIATFEDFINAYDKVMYHLDSPVADPSVVAIYLICEQAAKHVKVVLSGEGSDELFAGYRVYGTSQSAQKIFALPKPVKSVINAAARILPDFVKGKQLLLRGTTPVEDRFVGNAFIFDESKKQKIYKCYNPDVHFTQITHPIYDKVQNLSMLSKMQYCDINTWLKGDILVKGDRMSMAHSLEARVPFLDREVFEAASVLCDSDKLSHGTTKYIFRHAFRDIVNEQTFMRAKKGYPVPVRVWLKDELYQWAKDIILSPYADEFIDKNMALKLLEDHRTGKADNYRTVWTILTFISWYRLYVDKQFLHM